MRLAYRIFRTSRNGDVTTAVLILPDGVGFVYNEVGDVSSPYDNTVSLEVKNVSDIKDVVGRLTTLGLVHYSLKVFNSFVTAGEPLGLIGGCSLNVAFKGVKHDYYTLVMPEVMKYGVLATRNTIEDQVDLVVTVKKVSDLQHLEWILTRRFGFRNLRDK